MDMEQTLQFYLSLVFEQDENTGDFTAFYAQFPEASAQGRSKEEAKRLLDEIFPCLLNDKKEEYLKEHSHRPIQIQERQMQVVS